MKRFAKCLSLFLVCAAFPLSAQEMSFGGSLTTQAGFGLPNAHDNKGKQVLGTTVFDGVFKSYMAESMVYVNGQFVYDSLGGQCTNGSDAFVDDVEGSFAIKLKEAYLDYNGSWWALRAGRQIVSWGKADGMQVADIISPEDTTMLIGTDYKGARLGVDALRLSLTGEKVQTDAYWIPYFTPVKLPYASGNPLRRIYFPRSDELTIYYPTAWDDFELPEKKLSNSEFAARLSAYFSAFDLSFYGFYGWDSAPLYKEEADFDEEDGVLYLDYLDVGGEYKRLLMFAADAAIPAGDFVFRSEVAFFPNRYIQTNVDYQIRMQAVGEDIESGKKHHNVIALAGFDWTPGDGWTVTAQYYADVIAAGTDDLKYLERRRLIQAASLSIEKTLLGETLTLSAEGMLDLRDYSSASEVSAAYNLSDAITLSVTGNLFLEGPDDKTGMYGAFHDMSSVTLKGKISF